ncbi:hypothetical protein [Paenarthrobacter aurescens]|uniref:Uncharacterized protein n=1 Tax=Paenarthrobacter aurescens TaxID=43663 RepID=A0A4Y3NFH4_PAEAU|nr:hypothetical protein [Paenarthrobacter aurescens]MDO6145567.1 hypothetical protein [Paenarthrobacter aurescens]MDO6149376.1 hypothetical protein [Paenarthrobacter aurescens]MDO6160616.1 hypothetical protein [Paenarthrobacter aurescens]MDO6164475.1 hypothetical protein [Paenarthrobacter aurescens]GEB20013.1 hypothetical protein AAU01_27680 [Paenarthrobacter aurescens]
MDTTTRAPACSPSMTSQAHAPEQKPGAQSHPIWFDRAIAAEPSSKGGGKRRRTALIAGIVMGHIVTLFGPMLLGQWPLASL